MKRERKIIPESVRWINNPIIKKSVIKRLFETDIQMYNEVRKVSNFYRKLTEIDVYVHFNQVELNLLEEIKKEVISSIKKGSLYYVNIEEFCRSFLVRELKADSDYIGSLKIAAIRNGFKNHSQKMAKAISEAKNKLKNIEL